MTFFDPRKRDIFGGTSQTTVDWVKKVATETNNPQALDTIKKQEQEKIRDTMLGTNTSVGTTTQSTAPKTATGTVGGTPQSASGNTQTTSTQTTSTSGSPNTTSTRGSTDKSNATGTPVINPLAPKSNTPAYTDIAGMREYAQTLGAKLGSGQSDTDGKNYLTESLDQLIRGNYSGDVTGLGTTLQVLSGILGLDTAADVRDLYYDVTHWDGSKEHIIQTLLDVVGLIPVVGSLKYADEVGTHAKQGLKGADEAGKSAATAAKTAQKQFYEWPTGYKPSPYFTDDEIKYLLETEGEKPLSNAVEEVGETKIAGKSGTGYNGNKVESFTKEQLEAKPRYSPDVDKWQSDGGRITIDKDRAWTYHDREGNSVRYPDGYPDFKSAGLVKQELRIGKFNNYYADFKRADGLANSIRAKGNTWHHHQDGTTVQEMDWLLHRRFTHEGGMSAFKKK